MTNRFAEDDRDRLERIYRESSVDARDWTELSAILASDDEPWKHAWYEVLILKFRDHGNPTAWPAFADLSDAQQWTLIDAWQRWERFPHRPRDN